MTRITIEIPQGQDAEFLLALLQRLNYRVIQKPEVTAVERPTKTAAADLDETWQAVVKPIRQSQSIEEMVQEQNYRGFDRATFDKIIDELDIQDEDGGLLKLLRA